MGAFHNPYLYGRDCIPTHPDILGPYWSENHPQRSILANSEEPGTRIFISGTVTSNDCETPICNAIVDVWHANDEGCYTVFQDCESGNSDGDEHNLRGIFISNSFVSIWLQKFLYWNFPKEFFLISYIICLMWTIFLWNRFPPSNKKQNN